MSDSHTRTLEERLRAAEAEKSGQYEKRTEHIDESGNTSFINRLILEDSPYLLQHAHNPVNWYPWGEEAFEAAEREGKPIFLSIGYSTCHWCHVMEVESFDNVQVASVLNQHFISIKMDREQYPDIDEIYMTGVQLMSGHGGWPMSNFLLPDGRPFFGATYFPPEQFLQLLQQIVTAWNEKYSELETSAASIHRAIGRLLGGARESQKLNTSIFNVATQALLEREDKSLGGLAGAPKFPQEPILVFLLDQAVRERDKGALQFFERALHAMANGGICDQVGGGFHRYSVDAQWLVPHFEKMLYNQSQLGLLYSEAFRLTGNEAFARTTARTMSYVLRDMQLPEGGFYSATDADSEGAEGTFFLWTIEEIEAVLEAEESRLIIDVFGVSRVGNFEGSNILHLNDSLDALREIHGDEVVVRIDAALEKLYGHREQRIPPLRDEKLIVAWSAAMATTLAQAGHQMQQATWIQAAKQAVATMLDKNRQASGQLSRIYLNGEVSVAGQLEDYANLIQALLMLYRVGGKSDHLQAAAQLMTVVENEFHDGERGLFYLSPQKQTGPQLVRSANASDGATASAVATLLECLWWLEQLAARLEDSQSGLRYRQLREQCLTALAAEVNDNPLSHPGVLAAFRLDMEGSRGPIQFAAQGLVRVEGIRESKNGETQVAVKIHCADDWHLSAPGNGAGEAGEAGEKDIEALLVSLGKGEQGWQTGSVDYPPATGELVLPGSDKASTPAAIPIYSGETVVVMNLQPTGEEDSLFTGVSVEVKLQACSNERCLLPETLQLLV